MTACARCLPRLLAVFRGASLALIALYAVFVLAVPTLLIQLVPPHAAFVRGVGAVVTLAALPLLAARIWIHRTAADDAAGRAAFSRIWILVTAAACSGIVAVSKVIAPMGLPPPTVQHSPSRCIWGLAPCGADATQREDEARSSAVELVAAAILLCIFQITHRQAGMPHRHMNAAALAISFAASALPPWSEFGQLNIEALFVMSGLVVGELVGTALDLPLRHAHAHAEGMRRRAVHFEQALQKTEASVKAEGRVTQEVPTGFGIQPFA